MDARQHSAKTTCECEPPLVCCSGTSGFLCINSTNVCCHSQDGNVYVCSTGGTCCPGPVPADSACCGVGAETCCLDPENDVAYCCHGCCMAPSFCTGC